jgi:hypothetical protein
MFNKEEKEDKKDKLLYKKSNLSIDTNLDENELEEKNNNNFKFKSYVNGIIKIQNFQDYIIKLFMVASLIIIDCPHLIMDWYFLDCTILYTMAHIYLSVSMTERLLLGLMSYYIIITENLDDIYDRHYIVMKMPKLIVIGKIELLWSKYYSLIGIILAGNFYFINGYLNTTYRYILYFSILKLIILKILRKKINEI